MHAFELILIDSVGWMKLIVESISVFFIALGVVVALSDFIRTLLARQPADFTRMRFTLARHLALALELQLGADILATAVAPGWDEIGKLAAIAVIRTGLNFFLTREMAEQKADLDGKKHPAH